MSRAAGYSGSKMVVWEAGRGVLGRIPSPVAIGGGVLFAVHWLAWRPGWRCPSSAVVGKVSCDMILFFLLFWGRFVDLDVGQ